MCSLYFRYVNGQGGSWLLRHVYLEHGGTCDASSVYYCQTKAWWPTGVGQHMPEHAPSTNSPRTQLEPVNIHILSVDRPPTNEDGRIFSQCGMYHRSTDYAEQKTEDKMNEVMGANE